MRNELAYGLSLLLLLLLFRFYLVLENAESTSKFKLKEVKSFVTSLPGIYYLLVLDEQDLISKSVKPLATFYILFKKKKKKTLHSFLGKLQKIFGLCSLFDQRLKEESTLKQLHQSIDLSALFQEKLFFCRTNRLKMQIRDHDFLPQSREKHDSKKSMTTKIHTSNLLKNS